MEPSVICTIVARSTVYSSTGYRSSFTVLLCFLFCRRDRRGLHYTTLPKGHFSLFLLVLGKAMRSSSGGVCTHISSDLRVINASRPGHLLCGSLHRAFPLFPSILSASPFRAIILVDRLRLNALGAGGSDFAVAAFSASDAFLRFASLRSRVAYRDDPRLCCRLQAPYFTLCLSVSQ